MNQKRAKALRRYVRTIAGHLPFRAYLPQTVHAAKSTRQTGTNPDGTPEYKTISHVVTNPIRLDRKSRLGVYKRLKRRELSALAYV